MLEFILSCFVQSSGSFSITEGRLIFFSMKAVASFLGFDGVPFTLISNNIVTQSTALKTPSETYRKSCYSNPRVPDVKPKRYVCKPLAIKEL